MRWFRPGVVVGGILLGITGCSAPASGDRAEVSPTPDNLSRVSLFSVNAAFPRCDDNSKQAPWNPNKIAHVSCLLSSPLDNDPVVLQDNESLSKNAFADCGLPARPTGAPTAVSGLILTPINWAISAIISLVVDSADQALQDYIKSFTAQHAITAKGVDLYAAFPPDVMQSKVPTTVCLRYSRFVADKSPGGAAQISRSVAVDFIGSLTYDPADPNHLILRPIRLYYDKPARFTARNSVSPGDPADKVAYKVSPALSIATAAAGMHGIEVDSTQISMANFGVSSVTAADLAKPDAPYYHLFSKSSKSDVIPETRIPLPAWNLKAIGRGPESTSGDITVTITETGKPNEAVAAFAKWLDKQKDTVSKDTTAQAEKAVCNALDPTGKSCK
jgi:hypothetical protein